MAWRADLIQALNKGFNMKSNRLRSAISLLIAILPCLACCEHDVDIPLTPASAGLAAFPVSPFDSRLDSYRYGIEPNHITTAQMDNTIKTHYDDWKAHLIVDVPTVSGGKAIKSGLQIGVNVHMGGGSTTANEQVAAVQPQPQGRSVRLLREQRSDVGARPDREDQRQRW